MAVRFRAAARSHLGTVRTNNEDSALASDRLLVLADGMGGHAAGEVASVVALRVFAALEHGPGDDLGENVRHAGQQARRALVAMSDADPMLESLGTTLVTVVSDGQRVLVGHIGDSRVYVLRDSSMYQVTTDHTHVQRLIDQGQLTAERARTHPYRAMLLKSLDDHDPGPDLDLIDLQVQPGDRILLCSDGLSDYLTAEQIGQALAVGDREDAVLALINEALSVGTRDNVTVVVADVEDDDEPTGTGAVYVGAVTDGIGLSEGAAQALTETLPALRLDPDAPWRHAALEPDQPTAPDDDERPAAGGAADEQNRPGQTEDPEPGGTAPDDLEDPESDAAGPQDAGTVGADDDAPPGEAQVRAGTTAVGPPSNPAQASTPADDDAAAAVGDNSIHVSAPMSPVPALVAAVFTLGVLAALALFFFG